jgi:hypothetical protein
MTTPVTNVGPSPAAPPIDYTDKDFASLRQALLDLAVYRLPEWTDRSPADLGVLLVDLFSYMGDVISYYQDRLAGEAFLDTAVERRSVMYLLRLIGYELAAPTAAAAELDLVFNAPGQGQPTTVTVPNRAQFAAKTASTTATTVTPAFEYLGPDLTVDLAGAGVTARADGKLVLSRLPVRHSQSVRGEVLGSTTGEPNQRFALSGVPVQVDTLVVTVDEGAGPVTWTRRANLAYHVADDGQVVPSGPDSRDYLVQTDENGVASVVFGDGVFGRRPPAGSSNVRADYSVGGGIDGNVAAGSIAVTKTQIAGLASVSNPLPAVGGADAEPVDRAVRLGPQAFRSGDRAVTLNDYTALALQAGGVAKVRARSTGWNRVDLYVAPEGTVVAPCPPALKQRLVGYFDTRRMVGTSVRVLDAVPVPIDITVQVVPEPHYDPGNVQARAQASVEGVIAFSAVDFGRPLYLSKIYEAVEALDGVLAATATRFRRQDQAPPPAFLHRKGILLEAGLGAVQDFVLRAYSGDIAVEGRIDIGEVELPTAGVITVTIQHDSALTDNQ